MSNDIEETLTDDDLRPEYDFNALKAKPNRFAVRKPETARYVPLDPDVAAFYADSKELNTFLRAMIPILAKSSTHKIPESLESAQV